MASTPLPAQLKAIAIVTPYFIGDSVLASALIQNLINQYAPHTPIYCIAPKHQLSLFETLPGLSGGFEMPETYAEKKALLHTLQPEAAFLLRYSPLWALALAHIEVPYRIGFNLERFGISKNQTWMGLLTHVTPAGAFDSEIHQIYFYRQMLYQLGLPWDTSVHPRIHLGFQDHQEAIAILQALPEPCILLQVAGGSPGKRWPLSYWQKLLSDLRKHYGASFLAVGTASEYALYQQLQEQTGLPLLNLCGQTTLRQSAALCKYVAMVITLDTALAHIAAAVDCPRLVVLYGPTNLHQWRPMVTPFTHLEQVFVNVPCRPCITRTCYHKSCLRYLLPDRVFLHVEKAMAFAPPRSLE